MERKNSTSFINTLLILLSLFSHPFNALPSHKDFLSHWCGDKTCYEVLNLTRSTSFEEINRAYKSLAIKFHPDKNRRKAKEAEAMMQPITYAYSVISDPDTRNRYDEVLLLKQKLFMPRENPFVVAVFLTLVVTVVLHQYDKYRHKVKRKALLQNEAVRRRVKGKLLKTGKKLRIRNNKLEEDISDELLFETVREMNLRVPGGLKSSPSFLETLKSLPLLPITIIYKTWHGIRWIILYEVFNYKMSFEDKERATIKAFGLTEKEWNEMTQEERKRLLDRELWKVAKKTKK